MLQRGQDKERIALALAKDLLCQEMHLPAGEALNELAHCPRCQRRQRQFRQQAFTPHRQQRQLQRLAISRLVATIGQNDG